MIGSSCIGASVLGGVCNNSGGALMRRGPAFTELALYARVDADGGSCSWSTTWASRSATIRRRSSTGCERGDYSAADIWHDTGSARVRSATMPTQVRDVEAPTPARFNADPRGCSRRPGSAGKLACSRCASTPSRAPSRRAVFYIGPTTAWRLTAIRRHILADVQDACRSPASTCIARPYIAEEYGKDTLPADRAAGHRAPTGGLCAEEPLRRASPAGSGSAPTFPTS